jgi:hypothetical protein
VRTARRLRSTVLGSLAALGAASLSAGCSGAPSDPVLSLLAELEAAAEARDADRVGALLSAEFRAPDGLGKTVAVAEVKRYFTIYETVGLTIYGVSVERGEQDARVRCVIEFSGRVKKLPGFEGFLPPDEAYRFDFGLAKEGAAWRIRKASWELAQPEASPTGAP